MQNQDENLIHVRFHVLSETEQEQKEEQMFYEMFEFKQMFLKMSELEQNKMNLFSN